MRVYATLFDVRYLARGLVLYHSLRAHDPAMELWILCLDHESEAVLARLALPNVRTVRLEQLEAYDPALLSVKPSRTRAEYCFTLTPAWMAFVMETTRAGAWVSYADADLKFYSTPDPIFDELGDASVGVVPHNFPRSQRAQERFGLYNVGLVPFRNDRRAAQVLDDWRKRCLEWCSHIPDGTRYGDQKYLDAWPDAFPGVHIVRNPGAGAGPWNWMVHALDLSTDPPLVDGAPLIFYHFQRFRLLSSTSYHSGLPHYGRMPAPVRQAIYDRYARELEVRAKEAGLPPERERPWLDAFRSLDVREIGRLILHPGDYEIGA